MRKLVSNNSPFCATVIVERLTDIGKNFIGHFTNRSALVLISIRPRRSRPMAKSHDLRGFRTNHERWRILLKRKRRRRKKTRIGRSGKRESVGVSWILENGAISRWFFACLLNRKANTRATCLWERTFTVHKRVFRVRQETPPLDEGILEGYLPRLKLNEPETTRNISTKKHHVYAWLYPLRDPRLTTWSKNFCLEIWNREIWTISEIEKLKVLLFKNKITLISPVEIFGSIE